MRQRRIDSHGSKRRGETQHQRARSLSSCPARFGLKHEAAALDPDGVVRIDGDTERKPPSPTYVTPDRFVTTKLFATIGGYSANAVRIKISRGVWLEGREYVRLPMAAS